MRNLVRIGNLAFDQLVTHLTIPEPCKSKFFAGLREAVDEFGGKIVFEDTYLLMTVRKP